MPRSFSRQAPELRHHSKHQLSLGFDPLYIADEGKVVVIVAREDAHKAPSHAYRAAFGEVCAEPTRRVLTKTLVVSTRVVDVLTGKLLPRIYQAMKLILE